MKKLYNKAKNDVWVEQDVCMSVIARYGTGGGNLPIIVEPIAFENDTTIKIDGGALRSLSEQERIKIRSVL